MVTLKRATDSPKVITLAMLSFILTLSSAFFAGTWWAKNFVDTTDSNFRFIALQQARQVSEYNTLLNRLAVAESHAASIDIHMATQDVHLQNMLATLHGIRTDNQEFNAVAVQARKAAKPAPSTTTPIPGHN